MTWTVPEPAPADGPLVGDERPMLLGYLGWQRFTLLNICAGLTGEQLAARPVASTNLSLLGLVRHLAKVERIWFVERFGRAALAPMYGDTRDADFDGGTADSAAEDHARYLSMLEQADAVIATTGFDDTIVDRHGQTLSLRFVLYHLVHEYARHNGHADLLRQAIDGVTGR